MGGATACSLLAHRTHGQLGDEVLCGCCALSWCIAYGDDPRRWGTEKTVGSYFSWAGTWPVMDGWMDGTIKGHRDDEKES